MPRRRLRRVQIRLTLRSRAQAADIQVNAPLEATVADLRRHLTTWSAAQLPTLWSGSRMLGDDALLGGPGLRSGSIVGVDTPGERAVDLATVLRVDVIGGPSAGRSGALHRGTHRLGRDHNADLTLADPEVSRRHAELTVDAAGARLCDLGSTNGTTVLRADSESAAVGPEPVTITVGDRIRLGNSVVQLAQTQDPPAATRLADTGHLEVNRPPRLEPSAAPKHVSVPAERGSSTPTTPWLAALVPVLGGATMALLFHSWIYLALMLMAPLTMLATSVPDRIRGRPSRRRAAALHREQLSAVQAAVAAAMRTQLASRLRLHPDPAAVRAIATGPNSRVWERRPHHPDFLDVRVGLADAAADIHIEGTADPAQPPTLQLTPVAVSPRAGAVGLCGPPEVVLRLAEWAVGQIAALHTPNDVSLTLLLPDGTGPLRWAWTSWLPHLRPSDVAHGTDRCREIVVTLGRELDRRRALPGSASTGWAGPWRVLVVEHAAQLAAVPGLDRLIRDGPQYGITALCLETERRRLPPACTSTVEVHGETGAEIVVTGTGRETSGPVIADQVSASWGAEVARGLAPLVDPSLDAETTLPDSVRLVDLLEQPAAERLQRWAGDAAPATAIGVGLDGVIDIDLRRDGPHLLVAGTTGSGKSEFLRALVAGLATHCSPERLCFVLIDFKGGAAFAECAELPHTVGLVTDLDQHLTERALASLNAELRRREALFAAAAVADLTAYQSTRTDRDEPLPRLVIVVDEFASLVEELPDFVTGLVGIAQRGRSLGVHLVLATQRPSGVVSPEIRANMPLRLVLRVTDPGDSVDVLGADDAAAISPSLPGRAFLRRGSQVCAVQLARVDATPPPPGAGVEVVPLDAWGVPLRPGPVVDPGGPTPPCDLAMLVGSARQAAAAARLPAPRRPWLPPLPEVVATSDLPGQPEGGIGLVDDPARQQVRTWRVDLAAGGSMLLVGTGRTGRSTALRTLAATMAQHAGPGRAHLYVVDCAGGALHPLSRLPHCGSYVTRDDPQTVDRLLTRLAACCDARHVEPGDSIERPARPALVLLIDGWEGLLAATESVAMGRAAETVLHLVREAASVGLTVAITGGRAALTSRLAGLAATRALLRLADPADYAAAGLSLRAVPATMPPGRAVLAEDGTELHLAILGTDPSPAAQWRRVAEIAAASPPAPPESSGGPIRVRPLPRHVRLADLLRHPPSAGIVLGRGGDDGEPIAIDLGAPGTRFVVAGPARSGRSSALRLVAEQVMPSEVLLAGPAESGLASWARTRGRPFITPQDGTPFGLPDAQRCLILVDDVERFLDTPAGDRLLGLLRDAAQSPSLVAAGRPDELAVAFRGLGAEATRSRLGVLLRPAPSDGEVLALRLPLTRSGGAPGRGIVVPGPLLRHRRSTPEEEFLPIQLADPGPVLATDPQAMCG